MIIFLINNLSSQVENTRQWTHPYPSLFHLLPWQSLITPRAGFRSGNGGDVIFMLLSTCPSYCRWEGRFPTANYFRQLWGQAKWPESASPANSVQMTLGNISRLSRTSNSRERCSGYGLNTGPELPRELVWILNFRLKIHSKSSH